MSDLKLIILTSLAVRHCRFKSIDSAREYYVFTLYSIGKLEILEVKVLLRNNGVSKRGKGLSLL